MMHTWLINIVILSRVLSRFMGDSNASMSTSGEIAPERKGERESLREVGNDSRQLVKYIILILEL